MAQYSLRGWIAGGMGYSTYGFGGGPGWFKNSGEFGIQMCVYFPIAMYFVFALKDQWPRWKKLVAIALPLAGLTGMFSSSNRGTLVGGAAVLIWMAWKSKKKTKALLALVFIFFISIQFIPEEQLERFRSMGNDETSMTRLENWEKGLEMARMFPLLGVGFKNWQLADFQFFSGNGLLSHNIFIECLSELGYSGFLVFILLILFSFKTNHDTRVMLNDQHERKFLINISHSLDAALVGFLASGFFVTVLYYPYFWINLSFTVALNNIVKFKYENNIRKYKC
jgi:O-antigen ligase